MAYEWIGPAIAAAGSAVSSFVGQHPSKARRYAKEMARYNTSLAEEMYNKYESPQAQMRQYQAAGLNPNLVYSQNTGGPAAGAANFDADSMVPNEGKPIQGVANAIALYQQIRSQQIANQNANLVGQLTNEEIRGKALDNDIKESTKNYSIELKGQAVADMNFKLAVRNIADVNKTIAQTNSEIERAKKLVVDTSLSEEKRKEVSQHVKNLEEELLLMRERKKMLQAQVKEIVELLPFKKNKYQADTDYVNTRTEYIPLDYERNLINDTNQMDGFFGFGKAIQSLMRSKDHDKIGTTKRVLTKAAYRMWKDLRKQVGF